MATTIETFLAMDDDEVVKVLRNKAVSAAERKIAHMIYFHRVSLDLAAHYLKKADRAIETINARCTGLPLFKLHTRDTDFSVSRPDIARDLADAAAEIVSAAEFMAYAEKVQADPSIVKIAA